MKCREAEYWIYSLRPNTSWPVEVVTHLQGCTKCQGLRTKLQQIDQQINQVTSVPSNRNAKEQLLALIDNTPQRGEAAKPVAHAAWPWRRWVAYVSAAAALLLVGWLLGHLGAGGEADPKTIVRTVEVIREKPIEIVREKIVESQAERDLFAALLKHNARLVQSAQMPDRLNALLDMAEDCRKHALKLIEFGPYDALPFTIDLYKQLLRDGVVVQVQQAPAANRTALKEAARVRLQKMAEPATAPAKTLPGILQDQRDALETTARQSLEQVDQFAPTAAAKKETQSGPLAPAAALVQFAIAFSAEPDPVAKADTCSQCIQRLTPFMMLHLAEESGADRGDMGQQFGEMIQFGIYTPLASATAQEEPPQPVKDQADRAIQTTFDAVSQMEKHLEVAPARSKVAIERILEASKKNKGKGPPWLRDPFSSPEKSTPKKGKSGNTGKSQKKASHPPATPLSAFSANSAFPLERCVVTDYEATTIETQSSPRTQRDEPRQGVSIKNLNRRFDDAVTSFS